MDEKIGILVIHGIGAVEEKFKKDFENLRKRVEKELDNEIKKDLFWDYAFWLGEINKKEENYKESIKKYNLNNCLGLRDFILDTVADEVAYRGNREDKSTTYGNVQEVICNSVKRLYNKVGANGKLIIVAHSMGSTVISDYIWDIQNLKIKNIGENQFEKMQSIHHIFTLGSTLPLFLMSSNKIKPIKIENGKWTNYYDKDDILGYPMEVINGYNDIVADKEVNSGWNLYDSHSGYYKCNEVISDIVNEINRNMSCIKKQRKTEKKA